MTNEGKVSPKANPARAISPLHTESELRQRWRQGSIVIVSIVVAAFGVVFMVLDDPGAKPTATRDRAGPVTISAATAPAEALESEASATKPRAQQVGVVQANRSEGTQPAGEASAERARASASTPEGPPSAQQAAEPQPGVSDRARPAPKAR